MHRDIDNARQIETLQEPRRVVDVFAALFSRPIDSPHLLGLATGEAIANLNYLVDRGEASVTTTSTGTAHLYRRA